MTDRGLGASVWAPKNGQAFQMNGDWTCASCACSNFSRRLVCFRCSKPMAAKIETVKVKENTPLVPTVPSQPTTFETDRTEDTITIKSGVSELATSRWAPRNSGGSVKAADKGTVWTRYAVVVKELSTPSDSLFGTPENPPDLGLPYEVQHYILTMIQRILEEACYDFATRWIPDFLARNNWACAEFVELSTWKKTLPSVLPPKAIVPVARYSLDQALGDAVRIRNSAVHRHLCNTSEIRNMAMKAQHLMRMFSDFTRESKFDRLWTELKNWDKGGKGDSQMARNKLQEALQDIGERPIDDMDWTPNTVSLEEVAPGAISFQETEQHYMDAMELD